MRVCETQRLGSAAVLMISLAVYGISALQARQPPGETTLPWGNQGPSLMAVEVRGDRGRDGIYFLPEGMTDEKLMDLIGHAEINHQRQSGPLELSAGTALVISPRGDVRITEMDPAKKLALGMPVDLNRVSEEELSLVPGIGVKTAQLIIQLRREMGGFTDLADLTALPGIKEKKLNSLKAYLAVGPVR